MTLGLMLEMDWVQDGGETFKGEAEEADSRALHVLKFEVKNEEISPENKMLCLTEPVHFTSKQSIH